MGYRCAIVGCGARAEGHAAAYSRIPRGKLVACCDIDPLRLEAFGEQHRIPARYTDLDEMLARERPDVVHLVTKPIGRASLMRRLSDASTPAAIVEKPVCAAVDDYGDLRALSRETRTKFAVNHQLRHHPAVLDFLRRVGAGEIGEVRMLDASAGLPLAGQGVHVLDLMFAFAGYSPVETVFAAASGYDDIDGAHPSPRAASAIVTFRSGVRGILHAGEGCPVFEPDDRNWAHKRIAVYGASGFVHWRMAGWERSGPGGTVARGPLDYAAEDWVGQANLTEAVFDWLEDDSRPAPTNLRTSLDEWQAALAIYLSAIERRAVGLPFEPPRDLIDRYKRLGGIRA